MSQVVAAVVAAGGALFDSLVNRGEFFSQNYFASLLRSGLDAQRKAWADAEGRGESTSRKRVAGLGQRFFAHRADATDDPDELRQLHDAVLDAFGFDVDRRTRVFRRGEADVAVPVAAELTSSTGTVAVVLEAHFAADVDAALDPDGAGRLLEPLRAGTNDDAKVLAASAVDAVAQLFACDDPPRHVLITAGGVLVLADRLKWGEGRYLAVNLDDALGRADTKAKGELETIAGLFAADVLAPRDGTSTLDSLVAASSKHAVGVSADLRDGLRASIELLANEVITQRLATGKAVYNGAVAPRDLTTQCLRYLYRLVFLLFAEARPELGILPVDAPEYAEGYGLDRLRELALVNLQSEHAADGTHIQQSLELLFALVNDGYRHGGAQTALGFDAALDDTLVGLVFEPLESDLFRPDATPLLNSVTLRNAVLQQVLQKLMLTRERKGAAREFVSYANLGINQLGAVYEGLMAFTGFFATEDLYEVARNGDPHKGSWMVPVDRADDFDDDVFVTETSPDGTKQRVRHAKGSFVLRLSGRDRQRSASFYTPEVLTECVVRHALAELLDQGDEPTPARDILNLTVCEPALGSGAFLNEAIDQLAAEYLRRRQREVGVMLDPETYIAELQKVKAHLALHQCYGVDLNATAVELAEVSLWLNAMHPGLQAPWFGLHLRHGNSLIGARRATYKPDQLAKGAWLKTVPTDRPLVDGAIGDGEIHHFLLPAHGWGAVADAKEAKELAPDATKSIAAWRKSLNKLDKRQTARLQGLARRVEVLWDLATKRLRLSELELRRPIKVWEGPEPSGAITASRQQIEDGINDPDSPLQRLRLVMDAWCAMWFWPVVDETGASPTPPSLDEWLEVCEALLGVDPDVELPDVSGQLDLFADLAALESAEAEMADASAMQPTDQVREQHAWLAVVEAIAAREGFFHWELDFAPVFAKGGFDLQVGNPPWVRPRWEDDVTLAEFDAWFGVVEKAPVATFRQRRAAALADSTNRTHYLADAASHAGLTGALGSSVEHSVLAGVQTNLYLSFIERAWRNLAAKGNIGLLHPESHFADPKGGLFRACNYQHLRRHWQFANGLRLFEDVHAMMVFGVSIYGPPHQPPSFLNASHLQDVATLEASLDHDGTGDIPGIQFPSGGWDLRPHRSRVVEVDETVLAAWARLFDEPDTPPDQARLLRPVTADDLGALEILARQTERLADYSYSWTAGFHEKGAKEDGTIEWQTCISGDWGEVVLQGPHFSVATPFNKQPNEGCKSNTDYSSWDLESLQADVIPRTNYQRACDGDTYVARQDHWEGRPATQYWRLAWRAMTQPGLERSLHSALLPPGPMHVNAVSALALETERETARTAGLWSALPFDMLAKSVGSSNLHNASIRRFPLPTPGPYDAPLLLRTLRLNCLTAVYAPLWEELYDPAWTDDAWTDPQPFQRPLGDVTPEWSMDTPLRTDFDRRKALVELDALAALMLGLSADQLCAMYRSQFPILRKYEYNMAFDQRGRKIAKDHHAAGVRQQKDDWKRVEAWEADPASVDFEDRYLPPFVRPDREKEMRVAYETFARRYGTDTA